MPQGYACGLPVATDMPPSHGRPTLAEVSRAALRHNCGEAVRCVGPNVGVLGVVKADAYGHGAVAAGREFLAAGAVGLGVSTVDEGVELRTAGIAAPILVLGGAFQGEERAVVAHDLATAVWSRESAEALAAAARAARRVVSVHVKVETGMSRLGVDLVDVHAFTSWLRTCDGLTIDGVFSHFASADAVDAMVAHGQLDRFREAVAAVHAAGVTPRWIHLGNSAATLSLPEAHFTMVRPGLMLYGYAPAAHLAERAALRPAMRLVTRLSVVRSAPVGTRVGYGGTWVANRPSKIGVLPLGYADGLHRLASNRGAVVVRGRLAQIAGRVCMDNTMIDVTDARGAAVGDRVVVFGPSGPMTILADDVARWYETIAYEVLTSVGARVPRTYVEAFEEERGNA